MSTPAPALGKRPPAQRGPFAWVGAFTGFYPAQADEFGHLDPVTRFLYAARSVILVISAQSAVMAGLLAATDRRFEVLPFVLVFLGYVVLHAISNLSNDYFGYRRGHDTADSPRRRYTLHPIAVGRGHAAAAGRRADRARRCLGRRSPPTSSRCAAGRPSGSPSSARCCCTPTTRRRAR